MKNPVYITAIALLAVVLALPAVSSRAYGQIKARVTATADQLQAICGTSKVKVAFLCQGQLHYVDFSEATPQIHKLNIATAPHFPVISNGGRWITYQTGVQSEGPSSEPGSGTVWLRELKADAAPIKVADTGYVPRFALDAADDSPAILYATSLACPQQLCYNAGQTVKRQIVNGAVQPATVVFGQGSYFGGLSRDNRFLVTGWPAGPNAFMLDLQDTASGPQPVHTMRVKKNGTTLDTFVTIGTCNISRSASRIFTNTMLYFDFSSANIKAAGCNHPLLGTWKAHEKLFLSRIDGEDLKVFDLPEERTLVPLADAEGNGEAVKKEWENPEWSNHPYFAAASLLIDRLFDRSGSWEHTNNAESVYLIDLKDSSYVKLVESTDSTFTSSTSMNYPFVWVEVADDFVEDTAWLSKTIWERALAGVIDPYGRRDRFDPYVKLFSNGNSPEIYVYSVLGRKIASVRPAAGARVEIDELFRDLRPGVYLVGVQTPRGVPRQLVRWIKPR